jgi:rhodanese-related sulfurtransferase
MKNLLPKEAYQFLQNNPEAIFVDVRSEIEHLFVGHPIGSILVPWYDSPDWEVNPDFVAHVKKAAGNTNRPVILICRSGRRSAEAGEVLERNGFSEVYNVAYGFEGELDEHHHRNSHNGWRFDNLPWAQT